MVERRVTRDGKGRVQVFIPASLRDKYDLQNGDVLNITDSGNVIKLRPLKNEIKTENEILEEMYKKALDEFKFCCMDYQRTGEMYDLAKMSGAYLTCMSVGIPEEDMQKIQCEVLPVYKELYTSSY